MEAGHAELRNYKGAGGKVEVYWNWNDEATKDQIFKMRISCECSSNKCQGGVAYIDWEEMQKWGRWF